MSAIASLVNKKSALGYEPEDFTIHYWLDPTTTCDEPRAYKDCSKVVLYFDHLLAKAKTSRKNILDIGAGAGACVNAFLKAGYDAQGCEFSPSGRKVAQDLYGLNLEPCDLRENLPYSSDRFDWGLCVGVLSMIPRESMKNALAEIFRVVKYGVLINVGTLVLEYDPANGLNGNPHHITAMSAVGYWKILESLSVRDWTAIQPPQKLPYGIGMANEFAGLFSKGSWEFEGEADMQEDKGDEAEKPKQKRRGRPKGITAPPRDRMIKPDETQNRKDHD